jgi:hypothetical protein
MPCTYYIKIGEELVQTLTNRKQDRLGSMKTSSKHPKHPNYDLDDEATPDTRTKAFNRAMRTRRQQALRLNQPSKP